MIGIKVQGRWKRLELLGSAGAAVMVACAVPSVATAQAVEPGAAGATPPAPAGTTQDPTTGVPPLSAAQVTAASDATSPVAADRVQDVSRERAAGDIVVTGSRVIRDGFKAPTPTSVIGTELIANKAPSNVADLLNELPSLSASTTPRGQTGAVSGGQTGVNALNLRGIGANRTLILLDG